MVDKRPTYSASSICSVYGSNMETSRHVESPLLQLLANQFSGNTGLMIATDDKAARIPKLVCRP